MNAASLCSILVKGDNPVACIYVLQRPMWEVLDYEGLALGKDIRNPALLLPLVFCTMDMLLPQVIAFPQT